jgi:hypothetical protein
MRSILFSLLFFLSVAAFSQKVANYSISVSLNPETKVLKGKQVLTWTNTTAHAVDDLHFHTYLNAFKDVNSTFMKGSEGSLRDDKADTSKSLNFGNIKISRIILNDRWDLSSSMKYIQPDNANIHDQTVLKVDLPRKVLPGETIRLSMDFTSKLPKIFARTGWAADNYFFVGQWFPKIGVLEKNGLWNCHQFHADTEFYSDFGDYDVRITLPKDFVLAATGSKTSEVQLKNKRKTVNYIAENVHDFAWTASPHYIEYTENYKGIALKAFMQPENKHLNHRYFESVKNAIDYMEAHVGKYPYKTLSIIDPSFDGSGSGGMEYPTLITCGANWGLGKWLKYQELVTIHEFVHQYFQGMVATNEFENSWMDEGFTQYMETRIMDKYYPNGSIFNFFGFSVNDLALARDGYVSMQNPAITPIKENAWAYPKGTYGIMSYYKPATVLRTLQNILGEKTMDIVLKTYFERFKFKHPVPQDFFDVANEVASKHTTFADLNWFFDQTILTAKVCDYQAKNLVNNEGQGTFQLRNLKNMYLPVDVLVTFVDKSTVILKWDGKNRNVSYKKEIVSVYIDPDKKNLMDINMLNNSLSVKPPRTFALKYAAKIMFWMQNVLFWV